MSDKNELVEIKVYDIHVIPENDCEKHKERADCFCEPYWEPNNKRAFENGHASKRVIVHKLIFTELH